MSFPISTTEGLPLTSAQTSGVGMMVRSQYENAVPRLLQGLTTYAETLRERANSLA